MDCFLLLPSPQHKTPTYNHVTLAACVQCTVLLLEALGATSGAALQGKALVLLQKKLGATCSAASRGPGIASRCLVQCLMWFHEARHCIASRGTWCDVWYSVMRQGSGIAPEVLHAMSGPVS